MPTPLTPLTDQVAQEPVVAGVLASVVTYAAARYIPALHLTPDQALGIATLALGFIGSHVRAHVTPTAPKRRRAAKAPTLHA